MNSENASNLQENNNEKLLPFEKIEDTDKSRMLFRSRQDYILAGVLGGLAYFWDIDSKLVRLLFLITVLLTGGIMAIVYLISIKLLPLEPE
ncbi:MAG: PspC domain-containing protein [Asgard group archaeon]|nr:PspC domain-containing protein [Asgard group archaeon]